MTCPRCRETKFASEFYLHKRGGRNGRCKACVAEANMLKKYGLTQDDYDQMVRNQGGLCLICEESKKLFVDHCHREGRVRGLLCGQCNTAIGMLGEDLRRIRRALQYVEEVCGRGGED
jgi:hypothetical protein